MTLWTKWTKLQRMKTVNVHEAKTHLSRLLERVSLGEEITIMKAGKPVSIDILVGIPSDPPKAGPAN